MNSTVLHLWEGCGVELEYMIVDRDTLSVLPAADRLLHSAAGSYEAEIERGDLCWSNELALHVVELKTNGPAKSLAGLGELFQAHVREINHRLEAFQGRLMPTAMHPWMDPERETRLWPYEYNAVYETYHRIFDCRGHGWSNLQSAHLNLSFAGDDEFGALHAAIRVILPILPALCASSPLVECRRTGFLDNRMEFYRTNSLRIPSVSGQIAPEPVYTRSEYEKQIFQVMYDDIRSLDPEGILHHEWL
ncbi:MAG: carboxylate-amine ligase, partial [Candidatus Hinthialibacter sp.]